LAQLALVCARLAKARLSPAALSSVAASAAETPEPMLAAPRLIRDQFQLRYPYSTTSASPNAG